MEALAAIAEKLKRFTSRMVLVGVLYQKPVFNFRPEGNEYFGQIRHGLVDNLNANIKKMCKKLNKKEENRGVFRTIFYDTSRFKSFPSRAGEASDFHFDGIHMNYGEHEGNIVIW